MDDKQEFNVSLSEQDINLLKQIFRKFMIYLKILFPGIPSAQFKKMEVSLAFLSVKSSEQ